LKRYMLAAWLAVLASGCITGHGTRPVAQVKAAAGNLREGMSSAEVIELVGSPDDSKADICSWSASQKCIVWRYSTDSYIKELLVYFEATGGPEGYAVVHWDFH